MYKYMPQGIYPTFLGIPATGYVAVTWTPLYTNMLPATSLYTTQLSTSTHTQHTFADDVGFRPTVALLAGAILRAFCSLCSKAVEEEEGGGDTAGLLVFDPTRHVDIDLFDGGFDQTVAGTVSCIPSTTSVGL